MDNPITVQNIANKKVGHLRALLKEAGPLLVAYSGGVDSTLLLAEAVGVLGQQTLGVIADSPSLPRQALADALTGVTPAGTRSSAG